MWGDLAQVTLHGHPAGNTAMQAAKRFIRDYIDLPAARRSTEAHNVSSTTHSLAFRPPCAVRIIKIEFAFACA
jgi:hypothetical protein